MCDDQDYRKLDLPYPWNLVFKGEIQMWHQNYLPIPDKSTILDIGAGCGETALFYLSHGAEHVICIEGNPTALSALKKNFGSDSRVTIVPRWIDHVKVDIEGSEKGMIIETHGYNPRLELLQHFNDGPVLDSGTMLWRLEGKKYPSMRVVGKKLLILQGALRNKLWK